MKWKINGNRRNGQHLGASGSGRRMRMIKICGFPVPGLKLYVYRQGRKLCLRLVKMGSRYRRNFQSDIWIMEPGSCMNIQFGSSCRLRDTDAVKKPFRSCLTGKKRIWSSCINFLSKIKRQEPDSVNWISRQGKNFRELPWS